MKSIKFLALMIALSLACRTAQAQFTPRLGGTVKRTIERTVERKVEEKVEEETAKAVDRAWEDAQAENEKEAKEAEELLNNIAESQLEQTEAGVVEEIPVVIDKPYVPNEDEYTFFAMKEGIVQLSAQKDEKGNVQSQTRTTINAITGSKQAYAIAYRSEILDKNGKSSDKPMVFNYRIVVKDGVMYLDLKSMFGTMEGLDSTSVQVSGTAFKIPDKLEVGQMLEDASAKVRIGFLNCSVTMTDGKCLAIEDVLVAAGTFKCCKVTQTAHAVALGMKNESTVVTWYAKGIGSVKSETYDKKGKLVSSTELISMQQ